MNILVAVSGGVDSVVLLNLLAKKKLEKFTNHQLPSTNYDLTIVHFNHAIHAKSDAHEKFVKKLAEKYELEFFSEKAKKKLKSEAEAREARYRFLQNVAKKVDADLIALAHHAGDQAETILFNLIRGSGITGLGGMREVSGKLWRPLLQTPKEKILTYAKHAKLKWVEDPTNLETKYSRNFLRKEILPKLKRLNPKFEDAIVRTGRIARENAELMSSLAAEWLQRFKKEKSINLAGFNSLPPTLKREVIRTIYLEEVGDLRRIEEKHLEEILTLARNPSGGKQKKLGKLTFQTAKKGGVRIFTWRV